MPTAGDEGYERTVICPYERAHEVRIGRMQCHLKKCRRNFPTSPLDTCPLNSLHQVPKVEMAYHVKEECSHRNNWDRFTHDVGDTVCSVANLVPVTAGVLPDCDENWEDYDSGTSVIETIRKGLESKEVLQMAPTLPKAERKRFRKEQREKFATLQNNQECSGSAPTSGLASSSMSTASSMRRTHKMPEELNKQFYKLDLNSKPLPDFPSLPSSPPAPFQESENNFPSLWSTVKGKGKPKRNNFDPPPTMNVGAEEFIPVGKSFSTSPPSSVSTWSRPSTAMSQASRPASALSADTYTNKSVRADDGFCPLPVPGLGRGRKPKK